MTSIINIIGIGKENICSFELQLVNGYIDIDVAFLENSILNNYIESNNIHTYILVYNVDTIYYNFIKKKYIKLKIDNIDNFQEIINISITFIAIKIDLKIINIFRNDPYSYDDDNNFVFIEDIFNKLINNNINYEQIEDDFITQLYILNNCPKYITILSEHIDYKIIINYIKILYINNDVLTCNDDYDINNDIITYNNNYDIFIKYLLFNQTSKELINNLLDYDGNIIRSFLNVFAPPNIFSKNMYEFISHAVRQNGLILKYINNRMINKNILLEAVKQNGFALQFLFFKNYKENNIINRYIFIQNLFSEKQMSEPLIDEEIIIAAINQNPYSINFIPHKLLTEDIILMAYELNKDSIKYLQHDCSIYGS